MWDFMKSQRIPWVTYSLIVVNVIVYIISAFTGDLLYNIGALESDLPSHWGDWYQLLTSMFLHADLMHVAGNMILLYLAGDVVERACGHVFFTVLYMVSGFGGSALSIVHDLVKHVDCISVGASGAVFGIVGALLYLTIFSRGNYKGITTGRVVFMIIYMLSLGHATPSINNAAHVGGVLTGFAVMIGYTNWKMYQERGIYEN